MAAYHTPPNPLVVHARQRTAFDRNVLKLKLTKARKGLTKSNRIPMRWDLTGIQFHSCSQKRKALVRLPFEIREEWHQVPRSFTVPYGTIILFFKLRREHVQWSETDSRGMQDILLRRNVITVSSSNPPQKVSSFPTSSPSCSSTSLASSTERAVQ